MWRFTFVWNGWVGAPGYTNLYFDHAADVGTIATALDTFWTAVATWIPSPVTIAFHEGAIIEATTGELVDGASLGSTPTYTGSGAGVIAAPAGLCMTWRTNDVVGGRRVRGRTFIVPLATGHYQTDGTLYSPPTYTATAQDLIDDSGDALVVWHRPVAGTGGSFHTATDAAVRDRVSVLRSRAK